jgi:hypothetical protein
VDKRSYQLREGDSFISGLSDLTPISTIAKKVAHVLWVNTLPSF